MQEEVDSMPALKAHQQTRGEKLVATKKTIQNFQHATGIQLNLTTAKKIWNNEYKSFISEIQTGKEFNIGGIKIQLKDLERLQRGWISDELITLFLLMTRSAFEERHVYVVDSFFWKKLEQLILPYGSNHKKGWKDSLMQLIMKNPIPWGDLDSMKRLLAPIHCTDHWIMAVADFEEQFIEVYDSLPSKTAQHQDIFQVFKTWILAGVNDSLNGEIFDEYFSRWKLQPQPQNPGLQNNTSDCGAFVIGHLILLSHTQSVDRKRIGDILTPQLSKMELLRLQPRVGTRLKTNEDSGGTKYLGKTKQPGEVDHHKTNRRSSCLKGEQTQAQVKASTKYAHFPVEKWGAGGYSFVPISSEFSESDMNNSD
ncbi:cysteine proteinase [Dendrothele bispora CBS 962.96]|uniref:Cysteine proteinase n=1 Tax=Dendrothele bispora (strain CBS 962.96) TaxID=1314807 RepID=A0A4S8M9Z5_DENBC|nr:cysteine proteinase [Dendrothele bispora CBS 962.96]